MGTEVVTGIVLTNEFAILNPYVVPKTYSKNLLSKCIPSDQGVKGWKRHDYAKGWVGK